MAKIQRFSQAGFRLNPDNNQNVASDNPSDLTRFYNEVQPVYHAGVSVDDGFEPVPASPFDDMFGGIDMSPVMETPEDED